MKKFSELGIKTELQSFVGDKMKMSRIINKPIVVHAYKIADSKYGENKKCLYMQISIDDVKYVTFTGSKWLIDTIQRIPEQEFPFSTTIIKENDRCEFS